MTEQGPDRSDQDAREDIDAETVVDDARELFGAEDRSEPVGESDVPPPG